MDFGKASGNWFDNTTQKSIQHNSEVCAESQLVRHPPLADSNSLTIRPAKAGSELVPFKCNDGVTCSGPLNLARVPIQLANIKAVDDFLQFVTKGWRDREEDLRNLRNFIHRGRIDLAEGILLSTDGKVAAKSLFSRAPAADTPVWFEFCKVRPGGLCPDPAKPVLWDGKSVTVPAEPGFYKLVVDKKFGTEFDRTDAQAYVLLVPDQQSYDELSKLYAKALAQVETSLDPEKARRDLVTYLYYLGGKYAEQK